MSLRFRVILIAAIAIVYLLLIRNIRIRKLELRYSLTWMGMMLIILILAIFPDILDWMGGLFGVAMPINLIFFLGFCLVLVVEYGLTSTVSKLAKENKELAQKIALLEKELKDRESD